MTFIPESIKRAVRQTAGFGCCKCGFPIIEYQHIIPKSQNPKNIMFKTFKEREQSRLMKKWWREINDKNT